MSDQPKNKWGDYDAPVKAFIEESECAAPDEEGRQCWEEEYTGPEGFCARCGTLEYLHRTLEYLHRYESALSQFCEQVDGMSRAGRKSVGIHVLQAHGRNFKEVLRD